jgi:peptidoglycan hydrolase CwlO-like protein
MGFAKVDNRRMDRFHLRPGGRRARWARPAAVTLALAALAAGLALPARATPGQSGPASLAAARAEAARLQREVARLDLRVETLAEAHAGVKARLEGLIQASHRHQADLERSELALRATKAQYAGDVRDLYARGPLAPLELLLATDDMHELALATGAAGAVLGRDLRALSRVGLAAGTVRARVQELGVNQAETLALRRRLAGQESAIGELLATRKAMLATARAEVRAQVRAEQRRQEAARRALVAAAAALARTLGFAPRRLRRRHPPRPPVGLDRGDGRDVAGLAAVQAALVALAHRGAQGAPAVEQVEAAAQRPPPRLGRLLRVDQAGCPPAAAGGAQEPDQRPGDHDHHDHEDDHVPAGAVHAGRR